MIGPGKYDEICTRVREETQAEGVILMVNNGKLGNGFACQTSLRILLELPMALRHMADQIEADLRKGKI